MKKLRQWQAGWAPEGARRPLLFAALAGVHGLIAALAGETVTRQSFAGALSALGEPWFWLTALFLALAAAVAGLLFRSLFAGALLVSAASLVILFINYFKELITSTPLSFQDFLLAGQVGDIAALNASSLTLSGAGLLAILLSLVWLGVLFPLSGGVRMGWRGSLLGAGGCALAFWLVFWLGGDALLFTPLGTPVESSLSQTAVNRSTGVLLGIWRGALRAAMPDLSWDYSQQSMEEVVDRAEEIVSGQEEEQEERETPNIILILSESFFDITTLPGVTCDRDPLAEYHALQAEGVSGTFYTRTVGYGTCNIELEILTGINTALLNGEDLYSLDREVFRALPNVVSLLGESGYYTAMIHMFNDSIYHRTDIFNTLGFEDLFFSGDFAAIDPDAAAAADYWAYMNQRIAGEFYSDAYMAELLIHLYEQKEAEGPLFLYGISMENHTPYSADKYSGEERTVTVTTTGLSEEAGGMVQAIAQGAADASAALGALTDYFRDQEEPTVILFFGDHRPGLGLTDGGTVYSQLGMCSPQRGDWTLEQVKELYSTTYLIWSNDPGYLPGEPGEVRDQGSNYLGLDILNAAGVEKPLYWKLLEKLSQTRLNDTYAYSIDRTGAISETIPQTGTDGENLSVLRRLLEDAVYGEGYVTGQVSGAEGP